MTDLNLELSVPHHDLARDRDHVAELDFGIGAFAGFSECRGILRARLVDEGEYCRTRCLLYLGNLDIEHHVSADLVLEVAEAQGHCFAGDRFDFEIRGRSDLFEVDVAVISDIFHINVERVSLFVIGLDVAYVNKTFNAVVKINESSEFCKSLDFYLVCFSYFNILEFAVLSKAVYQIFCHFCSNVTRRS